jgi:serpin B
MRARLLLLTLIVSCKSQSATPESPPSASVSTPVSVSASASASVPAEHTMTAPDKPGTAADLAAVTQGDRAVAARLFVQLKKRAGNLFFSPASIRTALAMAWAGADGTTRKEMADALVFDEHTHPGFAALLEDWHKRGAAPDPKGEEWDRARAERKRLVLRVANRLWGAKGKAFQPDYLALLRDRYAAPLETLDFVGATEPSRVAINQWVARETEQKILDLLAPGVIDPQTRLVLANAVYFKASWDHEFYAPETKDEPFHVSAAKTVTAKTMHRTTSTRVATIDAGKVVELAYGAEGVAMLVFVPDAVDGLPKLEGALTAEAIDKALAALTATEVELSFPKFKFTTSFSLGEALSAMGMSSAFKSGVADFSKMDGTHELFISAAVHKAFVAVDEKGTEAAAATALAMGAGGAPPKPITIRIDRPFVFLIMDTQRKSVLFMGRVADPTA